MMCPQRIQLRRVKGWKMPENTVKVDRSTRYGNPYWIERQSGKIWNAAEAQWQDKWEVRHYDYMWGPAFPTKELAAAEAVRRFQAIASPERLDDLRGKNLGCWCRLCERHAVGKPLDEDCPDCDPCHADVLLELANRD